MDWLEPGVRVAAGLHLVAHRAWQALERLPPGVGTAIQTPAGDGEVNAALGAYEPRH